MRSEILEGTVRREDALEIKSMLQEEKENGSRFVSFPAEIDGLKKEDFTCFKSAFDAQHHAYDNTTDRDTHIVRSIQVVEREIDAVLENRKVIEHDHKLDKQQEDKRGRDQDLSR